YFGDSRLVRLVPGTARSIRALNGTSDSCTLTVPNAVTTLSLRFLGSAYSICFQKLVHLLHEDSVSFFWTQPSFLRYHPCCRAMSHAIRLASLSSYWLRAVL